MSDIKIMNAAITDCDMVGVVCQVDDFVRKGRAARNAFLKAQAEPETEAETAPAAVMHHIVTLNAEILYRAQDMPELLRVINAADLVTPDGSGIVWAVKELTGREISRVTGIDLMQELCKQSRINDWNVYLFGGAEGVAAAAAEKLEADYGCKVCGHRNGFFKPEDEEEILANINAAEPDILFVALGAPKQEFWIDKYRERLLAPTVIGVGGSFDVISGNVKRAPVFFQRLGIEWLWRLIREPWRFKRMLALPKFMLAVKKISYRQKSEAQEKLNQRRPGNRKDRKLPK